jgi:predicted permease
LFILAPSYHAFYVKSIVCSRFVACRKDEATGLTREVLILLAGTPTAVNISILAVEFNARPHFVAAVVFATTVLSFLTLSVTLAWLL